MSSEQEFREIENLLNGLLSRSLPKLSSDCVEHSDKSCPTYHYKNELLTWEHIFSKEWKVDYERMYVKIWVSFSELEAANRSLKAFITGGVYSEGREDRFPLRREIQINFDKLSTEGMYEFLTGLFSEYKSEIEESM